MATVWKNRKQEVEAALKAIYERDGIITPAAVVAEAVSDESPLHSCFEWDNEKAADAHRLEQARQVIREVQVDYGNDVVSRTYVHVAVAGGYVPVEAAVANASYLESALNELKAKLLGLSSTISSLQAAAETKQTKKRIGNIARHVSKAAEEANAITA